jgi:hypothetical protein
MSGRLGDAGENVKSNLRAVAGAREIEDGPTRDRVLDVTVGEGRTAGRAIKVSFFEPTHHGPLAQWQSV